MGCYNCGNLDVKKKSAGKLCGSLYFCKKTKQYVNPCCENCKNYKKSERKPWDDAELYKEGKNYSNTRIDAWVLIILFALLIIIGLFSGVFDI